MALPLTELSDEQLMALYVGIDADRVDSEEVAAALNMPQVGEDAPTDLAELQSTAAAEASLYEFVKQAWEICEPETEFKDNWHIWMICEHLEAVAKGDDSRVSDLIINIPPGFMKSYMCSVFLAPWAWGPGNMPHLRFLHASYDQQLSTRDSMRARQIIQSDWYQDRWRIPPSGAVCNRPKVGFCRAEIETNDLVQGDETT